MLCFFVRELKSIWQKLWLLEIPMKIRLLSVKSWNTKRLTDYLHLSQLFVNSVKMLWQLRKSDTKKEN